MNQPNILILMTDQQRFDALGCANNPNIKTPNLDALAASGVHFTQAVTPTPICVAARLSFITGHRIARHRRPANAPLPGPVPELPTLMSLLSQKGYWTQGIGKMHFKGRHFGFHNIQSMEECPIHRIDDDYLQYLHANGVKTRFPQGIRDLLYYQPQTSGMPLEHSPNTWVASQSVNFIRQHRAHRPEQPFFLWSSWISPHPPFAPCEPYDNMYDPADMNLPTYADRPIEDLPPSLLGHRARLDGAHRAPDRIRRIRALYNGLVSHVDNEVGRILNELDAQGIADNTVVIFVSDHGDMLGDHGLSQKNCPYEPSARIPFILHWPDKTSAHKSEDLVSLLDVLPTFIDELDLLHPDRASLTGDNLVGKSGGGLANKRTAQIIDYAHGVNRWVSIRTETHKYAWFAQGGVEELYDLKNDPGEVQNLAVFEPNLVQQFSQQAIAWEEQHGFLETLDGDMFRDYPLPDAIPKEEDCRTVNLNTGPWPKRLLESERDTVETFAEAFDQAVKKETTLSADKVSIDIYDRELERCDPLSHGSEGLEGTSWGKSEIIRSNGLNTK